MSEEKESQQQFEPMGAASADTSGKPAIAERDFEDKVNLHVNESESAASAPMVIPPAPAAAMPSMAYPAGECGIKGNSDHDEESDDADAEHEKQLYNIWRSGTQITAATQLFIWVIIGAIIVVGLVSGMHELSQYFSHGESNPFDNEDFMNGLLNAGKNLNIPGLVQVLKVLPAAVIACVATSAAVVWVGAKSRSRRIDWTDSHLIVEWSGPVALTFRWSAIAKVEQGSQWELFHGRQPVFVITTKEDNVFHLRLSDISYKHNIGEFFSLIKTNAPNADLHVSRNFASDNSYTELWLKYFSAPAEREKTGLLDAGMYLDNGRYKVVNTIGGGGQGTAYLVEINHEVTPAAYEETDETFDREPIEAVSQLETVNPDSDTADGPESGEVIQMRAASDLAQAKHIMKPRLELSQLNHVVLKEYILPIHRGHLTAERTADKLKAEAQILQRLHHPQIVGLLDAFIEDYRGYLVLDYVAGESLKAIVDETGTQPEAAVINWALQVCAILRYLHGLTPPVVHRDITPDNLLLQDDGDIKIVDFNVAYQVDSSATATVVGKHAYIPAEQFRGKPTPQSDIYALGGTMFYLLTGREPEPITESHPREVNEKVSATLDAIVGRATAYSLLDRYADVDELSEALRELAMS
ncbi:MAG TPA: serine/threonine-protein kinase [Planktothrix sp.]|jgi:tRNA A-37 threonylcarbamoyl transferase component Bud32